MAKYEHVSATKYQQSHIKLSCLHLNWAKVILWWSKYILLSRVYLGNTPSTDESHTKLETMMVDLAQQMTTVKHEQEYMEVRERIHT